MENQQIELLEQAGMKVVTPDKAAFLQRTMQVYDQYRDELGEDAGLLDQIINMQ
jgi:TRAP-type C4-dicarboxylate transport system substrate-binding protein